MGPSLLIVSLFVCIWLYEVDSQNHVKVPKEQRMVHSLLINEVNADSPGEDTLEYLELYHISGRRAPLDGYSLVLYNGNGNVAYNVKNLQGLFTDDQGFLLMGSAAVVPKPKVILPKNTIQNGPDAIALYFGRTDLHVDMEVTSEGLVDALVHKSKENDRADELVAVLTPGVEPFLEDPLFRTTDESLERCQGADSQWFFQVGVPTPSLDNHCIPFSQLNASFLLINEVNIAFTEGEFEFIELQGPPSSVVKDVVLALIDGKSQEMYFIMEVRGKTSPEGLLLLGPEHPEVPVDVMFPQNSTTRLLRTADVNAVVLYSGSASNFAIGDTVLATNLLDAFVYTGGNASSKLQDILTPGKSPFYVRERSLQNYTSVSRCFCCSLTRDPSVYAVSQPTPQQFNDCPKKRFSQEISLCFQVADCQQGSPEKSEILMYLAEVVREKCKCNVHPNSSKDCQQQTSEKKTVTKSLSIALEKEHDCEISPAFFKDSAVVCQGTELIFSALLTAKSAAQLDSLMQAFSIVVDMEEELNFGRWNFMGVNACLSQANVTNMPPGVIPTEPRTTKAPPAPLTLLINEVNPDNPGSREDTEYIELFYPGPAPFELWNYWLVLYNGKNNLAYYVVKLGGYHTDKRGYFLVGSAGVTPRPSIILPDNTIQNGAEAVALYHSPKAIYKINMPVTAEGLVDVVVYKSRGSDKADRLLAVLTPGQSVVHENESHSTEDESLSRCLSLSPRDQSSFQVTEITPFQENTCPSLSLNSTEETLHNHSIVINELGMNNDSLLYQFVELKGKPGVNLKGYTLKFFTEHNTKLYFSIPLQGTFGNSSLFIISLEGESMADNFHEQSVMPSVWSEQQHNHRVALVRHIQAPNGTLLPDEIVEDVVTFTQEPHTSKLNSSFPIYFFSRKEKGPFSLSRCSSCEETFAVSNHTPGTENVCPQDSLSLDLEICLLTFNCSMWPQNALILASLQQTLVRSMEESCHCGVSSCYIQGLNFTCLHSILKLSGQVWATSPEQLQLFIQWRSSLSTSPHPFPMEIRLLKGKTTCSSPSATALWSEGSLQAWEIALTVLGSILLALLLAGVAFYWIKRRPQNYTTIELNDRCEIMAEI
ncbi:uncharacterized protein LOC121914292 [Sceloporus undulatus]|uniref:uncharacterized protein LOC121914292 n=1 Tax=Sceloporus undulatus TaxID=8520 RepID=UPI001C4B64C8|nr:uncharacterized protein LOC121914292 [Sceloporus undulatus]XP_042293534.1 uncharacterized protein LOC121914292 [Sceloporus undulatus]XP_042293535.1 uncharacterized protein LOC121914292 [Sceloporus undulatus]XP_042293536.1 uncharacterized protein LOC121914292 [Sceloporus undulatus]XP_042293537.1 uncharacterized protein LOC121914292 [Sceloporus undulatus]XP_042293539.1 uncharacterized protein LOC121914292 [Sceloporus undulatus]